MSQYFTIHPENPPLRLIRKAAEIIHQGGVVIYPTDSTYAIGCHMGDVQAINRIARIRRFDAKHHFTVLCPDLSAIANYARISNGVFRMLKSHTPGPYTFILKATSEVPRKLHHPKRKTIGIRVPDNNILQALLVELVQPMMTSTLQMPDDDEPMNDPEEIKQRLGSQVDLIIDGGMGGTLPTTVIDLVDETPSIVRQGCGDSEPFYYA